MRILEDVSLKLYSTMRLGGSARYVTEVTTREEAAKAAEWADRKGVPVRTIGIGSNIVWKDEGFDGLLVICRIPGKTLSGDGTLLQAGAGEVWDDVVNFTVQQDLSGIECLSLIPGMTGATPVQNVGAYGQEIANVFVELEAYDTKARKFVRLTKDECDFGYRTSRFKTKDSGRFMITSVTLQLSKKPLLPPFYDSLQKYLHEHEITTYTPKVLRDAVVDIRSHKLPDPAKVANTGSFFANPVITQEKFERLKKKFPTIVGWPQPDGKVKVAAAWVLDQAGYRNFHDHKTGMGTWKQQALVLVNETARSTADLLAFRKKLTDSVQSIFGITLEQEPELLP